MNGKYLRLIFYKSYADLRAESARTYVGYLWWLLDPILSMIVYYVVFGIIFERRTPDYVPFLFVGLVTWRWLNMCLMHGATSISDGRGLMQQVYLPKIVFPSVRIVSDTVKFLMVFAVLLVFLRIWGYPMTVSHLALPGLLFIQLLLIAALSYLVAAIVPFLPDLRLVLDNVLRLLFFLSGIFFAIDTLPTEYQFYVRLNPIASLIEAYREVLLYGRWPSWPPLLATAAISAGGIAIGSRLIARFDHMYPKLP